MWGLLVLAVQLVYSTGVLYAGLKWDLFEFNIMIKYLLGWSRLSCVLFEESWSVWASLSYSGVNRAD